MKTVIPFVVYEITPRCNLTCQYCYNIWKMPGGTMPKAGSFGQIKKTLKQLFKIADVQSITFSGGEPFLFKRLLETVLFCYMKQKQVLIISNGTVGRKEDYEALIKMKTALFEFPVHSYLAEEHDRLAGVKGAWEKAVQSVKTVLSLGGQVVAVIVITRINYQSVPRTMQFIKELGIRQVMLNRFNIGGTGIQQNNEIGMSKAELQSVFAAADQTVLATGLSVTSNVCSPFCVINPDDYPHIGFSACYPKETNRSWTLDPFGNIRFCNHSPKIVGNIYKHTFEEMLNTPYIHEWQETIPEICQNCTLFTRCWAGCRAAAEQLGQPLSQADPLVYLN